MASAFTIRENGVKNALKSMVTIHCGGRSVEVVAQWDTGATASCISEKVVSDLELVETGYIPRHTPSGHDIAKTYLVDVTLPNDVQVPDLRVCDSKIGDQGIGMLIGMDIINRGDFAVSNHQGKTVFSFRMPSEFILDFVTGIRVSNIINNKRSSKARYHGKKRK